MAINGIMQTKSKDVWKLIDDEGIDNGFSKQQENDNRLFSFFFPPPPRVELPNDRRPVWQSVSDTDTTTSDSQSSDRASSLKVPPSPGRRKSKPARNSYSDTSPVRSLPPIGVFWDIENCQIPRGKSAVAVAQAIRDKFFSGYREAEFLVVCDVKKETVQVIQELNDAQLNLIHVGSTFKNAADEKLRQSMRRFADTHGSSAVIVLISGDVNFAPDVCDLRHRKKIHVILVHNEKCSESLMLCANENHSFQSLVKPLPVRTTYKPSIQCFEVVVTNLPPNRDPCKVRCRLKRLAENCGGRVGYVVGLTTTLRFPSLEFALRAKKRLEGENVFGSTISVGCPLPVDNNNTTSPMKARFGGLQQQQQRRKTEETLHFQPALVQYTLPLPWQPSMPLLGMYNPMPMQGPPLTHPPPLPAIAQDTTGHHVQSPRINTPGIMWDPTWQWNSSNIRPPPPPLPQPANGPCPVVVQRGRPILGSQSSVEKQTEKTDKIQWLHNSSYVSNGSLDDSAIANGSSTDLNGSNWSQGSNVKRSRSISPVMPSMQQSIPANWQWQQQQQPPYQQMLQQPSDNSIGTASGTQAQPSAVPPAPSAVAAVAANWNQTKNTVNNTRKCRTPSPYIMMGNISAPSMQSHQRPYSPFGQSHSDSERTLNPGSCNNGPVELHVTNLDQSIDPIEMKKILMSMFQEHVMVLHVSVFVRSSGSLAAVVRVPSQQGAQYAISQLHRRKIGLKRIMISYARSTSPHNPHIVRWQVVSLLREVPGHQLPLFKFREMFESRYLNSISASDLYRMHDVCTITEGVNGRTISLNAEHSTSTQQVLLTGNQENGVQQAGVLVCSLHARMPHCNDDKGWAEQEAPGLPCLRVPLSEFSSRIHALVHSHNNMLPLSSLCDCYEDEFGSITLDESGVPLEHLVTCVSGIQIKVSDSCAKYLCSAPKNQITDDKLEDGENAKGTVSPPLAYNLLLFSREIVDLLRNQPHCILSFNKFIPSYHHHFHRQCRVADYGFTRLIDLFEALPHIVQVMGDGNKRMLTLSHRSQMRRFTSDLLRVLKVQPNKLVNINELLTMFEKNLGKPFDPVDYGLCYLSDLLSQLMENTVVITNEGENTFIAIPKREQTPEEMERTKLFAQEVVELMSHSPQCSMMFEKFIPAYHHHFGYQCRVADFGFTKLIELFESIPQIVKIEEDSDGERRVTLVNDVKLKVLGDQVSDLVHSRYPPGLPMSALSSAFQWQYGYSLKPVAYGCEDLNDLIAKLHSSVKLEELDSGQTLVLVDQKHMRNISLRVWRVLIESSNGKMSWSDFEKKYQNLYKQNCSLELISRELQDTVNVIKEKNEVTIQLTSLKLFARDVYRLLYSSDGRLAVNSFEATFFRCYGTAVQPALYGHNNLVTLLQAIPQIVILRGKGVKRLLILNKELAAAGISLPCGLIKNANNMGGRSSSTSDVESRDPQSSWPLAPSEALLKGLTFPKKNEEDSKDDKAEKEKDGVELLQVTPKKNWRNNWPNSSNANDSEEQDFVVHLPKFNTPPPLMDSLVSPCKYLLPATSSTAVWPLPLPPDPSELPMPKLYLEDTIAEKPEEVVPRKVDLVQDSEGSCSGSETGNTLNSNITTARRKLRLAAQFQTPLELDK